MQILLEGVAAPEGPFKINLNLDDSSTLTALGQAVWQQPLLAGACSLAGVEFTCLGPGGAAALQAWVGRQL